MWHEARKQERKIRGMMVDYKKRSERRRLYYHRIKADPTQFLRLQGVSCKIYVEEDAAEIESAASALMPWQGDRSNMIDRFDVRANLDIIPEPGNILISSELGENAVVDQKCQYERWRTLATNDLVGLGEEECLAQIAEDESAVLTKVTKKSSSGGAKIGFSYDSNNAESDSDSEDSDADSKEFLPTDPDLDITFDVRELDTENKSKLNEIAAEYYAIPDFTRLHIEDKVESEMREFEIREEQNRAERVAKLSKTERRKEKEERRKSKDVPPHMRVDDPYRNPHSRRSSSRRKDESDSSSDEEKTVQNIEISSARSNTYKNVKSIQKPIKMSLPTFLQPKTTSTGLTNLVAARKQLLSKSDDTFDFGIGSSDSVEPSNNTSESKPGLNSRSHSRSPEKSRSRRSRSGRSHSRSSSRGRSHSRGRSRSKTRSRAQSRSSRSRSRSRGRSRSRSRGRKYSSTSSRHRSRSRTRGDRGLSPRRKVSPAKDARPKSPETLPKLNELPLKKADSLKALKPHERLKLKLQSQLKKRQRDEKRKEQAQIEAKEQEAFERAEELKVLKRQMWEKEEEEYWKKREEEEREYQKKKAEEKALKADDSSSNGEKHHSRSRSGSRRRHRSRSRSREKSAENRNSKRPKSTSLIQDDTKSSEASQKISLVPEYEGADGDGASSRNSSRRRDDAKDRPRADDSRRRSEFDNKQRSDESRRRSRNEGDRRRSDTERKYPGDSRHGESDRSRYQGGSERGERTRHSDCVKRRDEERGRYPDERTRCSEEPQRGRDRDRGSYRSAYR